jgi:hypothetical protein
MAQGDRRWLHLACAREPARCSAPRPGPVGSYQLHTWINNCLQLGGYYARSNAFALAMYCHAAAQAGAAGAGGRARRSAGRAVHG